MNCIVYRYLYSASHGCSQMKHFKMMWDRTGDLPSLAEAEKIKLLMIHTRT